MNPINFSTSRAIFVWRPAAWLRATGPDAETFLQGQFSNDLRKLERGGAVYGLWLSIKGRVLADSFVLRGHVPDEFWIGSYFSFAAVIRERLESHIIADDVIVEDATGAWAGITLLGDDDAALALRESSAEGFVFRGRRGTTPAVEIVFPVTRVQDVSARFAAARPLGEDEMTRLRIDAAIPAVPVDIGPGDLPNEAGLDTAAISYTKGCYLGQEVMARLKSMGQVRRRLLRVAGTGDAPRALPAPVFAGVRQVGEVRSAVSDGTGGWVGLAMVSLLHVSPSLFLSTAADAEPSIHLKDRP